MRAGPQQQLVFELTEARSQMLAAIAGLSEEQMGRPELDGWSVKDHLTHLTIWDEFRFFEISRIARGGGAAFRSVSEETVDSINDAMTPMRRALPLSQVLADMEFARSLVLEAVARAPEQALDDGAYGEVGLHGSTSHDISHAAAIRAWRERQGL